MHTHQEESLPNQIINWVHPVTKISRKILTEINSGVLFNVIIDVAKGAETYLRGELTPVFFGLATRSGSLIRKNEANRGTLFLVLPRY